jgi:hypothetical protein
MCFAVKLQLSRVHIHISYETRRHYFHVVFRYWNYMLMYASKNLSHVPRFSLCLSL